MKGTQTYRTTVEHCPPAAADSRAAASLLQWLIWLFSFVSFSDTIMTRLGLQSVKICNFTDCNSHVRLSCSPLGSMGFLLVLWFHHKVQRNAG